MVRQPDADRVTPAPAEGAAPPRRAGRRTVVGFAAAVAALAVGAVLVTRRDEGVAPPTAAEVEATASSVAADAILDLQAQPARAAQIYPAIAPSLVVIEVERAEGEAATGGVGLGTGVIVNADGTILTAHHVIEGATAIGVRFADGTRAGAVVVAEDAANDTAVVMADGAPEVIVPAVLGGAPAVGDDVYAVGHPLGLTYSMSAGVVSGLQRTLPIPTGGEIADLIQFDAAVNPGNSGGPLLNRNGEVVGIVTSLADPSEQGYFVGIGFAVPIATAGGAAGSPAR